VEIPAPVYTTQNLESLSSVFRCWIFAAKTSSASEYSRKSSAFVREMKFLEELVALDEILVVSGESFSKQTGCGNCGLSRVIADFLSVTFPSFSDKWFSISALRIIPGTSVATWL
jgi:hypothetical protein